MTTYEDSPAAATAYARGRFDRGALADGGRWAVNYALALIFLWFGCLKFTDFEASGIAPLIINSPWISWLLGAFGVAGAAHVIGVIEIATGLLIAARPFSARASAVGGAMATVTFLITVSFLFSTPGVVQPGADNPLALSPMPGQFLLKDVVLLCVSIWIMGASLVEAGERRAMR